jgi:hypothetical protein
MTASNGAADMSSLLATLRAERAKLIAEMTLLDEQLLKDEQRESSAKRTQERREELADRCSKFSEQIAELEWLDATERRKSEEKCIAERAISESSSKEILKLINIPAISVLRLLDQLEGVQPGQFNEQESAANLPNANILQWVRFVKTLPTAGEIGYRKILIAKCNRVLHLTNRLFANLELAASKMSNAARALEHVCLAKPDSEVLQLKDSVNAICASAEMELEITRKALHAFRIETTEAESRANLLAWERKQKKLEKKSAQRKSEFTRPTAEKIWSDAVKEARKTRERALNELIKRITKKNALAQKAIARFEEEL